MDMVIPTTIAHLANRPVSDARDWRGAFLPSWYENGGSAGAR